jgi:hypothetical protein
VCPCRSSAQERSARASTLSGIPSADGLFDTRTEGEESPSFLQLSHSIRQRFSYWQVADTILTESTFNVGAAAAALAPGAALVAPVAEAELLWIIPVISTW